MCKPTPTARDHVRVLQRWPAFARAYWWNCPDRPGLGCFGTGYNSWGVQTNQKFLGACAVLATAPQFDADAPGVSRDELLDRALRALRFSLASHVSGPYHCTDGTQWGHTWISALGVERMMHGVFAMRDHLTDQDQADLRRMLTSESDWLLTYDVQADPWARTGKNKPESNLWNGAILLRAAMMYPDETHAADWIEQGTRLLINSISVPDDAVCDTTIAGRPVREWHVGANFFPHYALDHHGYLNVGYMVICLSNAAMIHYGFVERGHAVPEAVYHHVADLWRVVRRLVFADGRLARIGGDTRQRYCYCQDYLLPTLVFMGDHFGDRHAAGLEAGLLGIIEQEQASSGDGGFLSRRLETMRTTNPYYYTRLESDKAVCLSMAAYWHDLHAIDTPAPEVSFEESVRGPYAEPEHGAMMHRSPTRLVSWSWRASEAPQGLCLPPRCGHLAEWTENLAGRVRVLGETGRRRLVRHQQATFTGGFVTWGEMIEGTEVHVPEGWSRDQSVCHQFVFAALPDDRTAVLLEHARLLGGRVYLTDLRGLHLNVPNDLFNDLGRRYHVEDGPREVAGFGANEEAVPLESMWVNVEDALGVVGIYGADSLTLYRPGRRAGGYGTSLYADQICFPCQTRLRDVYGPALVLDIGAVVLSDVDHEQTRTAWSAGMFRAIETGAGDVRCVRVTGGDARAYVLAANFGTTPVVCTPDRDALQARGAVDLSTGQSVGLTDQGIEVHLAPGGAMLLCLDHPTA